MSAESGSGGGSGGGSALKKAKVEEEGTHKGKEGNISKWHLSVYDVTCCLLLNIYQRHASHLKRDVSYHSDNGVCAISLVVCVYT